MHVIYALVCSLPRLLLFTMDRPSRNRGTVNYRDFLDDDDEDFATVKAPPNKKARVSLKEPHHERTWENSDNSAKEIIDITAKSCTTRVSLDKILYERNLEAALSLSLLQNGEKLEEPLTSPLESEKYLPPVLTHCNVDGSCLDDTSSTHPPRDSPPVLSNCSVDASYLGLEQISSEQTLSPAISRQRKTLKTTEQHRQVLDAEDDNAGDEDYKPQNTPESDADFSEPEESDDEYAMKPKRDKKSRKEKKTASKAVKKTSKAKPQSAGSKAVHSRSPGVAQSASALKTAPITPPAPKLTLCSSPAGGRQPKWNPPGLVGNSPTSCQSTPVKSPGLGLRLGLSRLARVKRLHPNTAAH